MIAAARRPPSRPDPITVNGVAVSRAAIAQEIQNHPAPNAFDAWHAAARALVVRELLLQEAHRLGLAPAPLEDGEGRRETDDEALIRALIEREVRTPEADAATCRRYFERNPERFRSPDLHEASHILIAAPPDDTAARAEARRQAAALIAALAETPAAFAEFARAHSACPSAATGGNLGQIGPGQTVPEFERALAVLPEGTVAAQPVETRYGVHVVRIERRIAGRALPFELIQARIAAWLGETARRGAIRQYIAALAGRAAITGIALAADASPRER
jgi:peptidyl-prolyl cis-trans isomerase C